jgi:ribosomal protein S18 acetylase RimI-like enzyme
VLYAEACTYAGVAGGARLDMLTGQTVDHGLHVIAGGRARSIWAVSLRTGQCYRSPDRHLQILAGSSEVVLVREETGMVAGFVTAVTDGVLAAYIPVLEVRRDRRGQGIGTELMQRMLDRMSGFYMVD